MTIARQRKGELTRATILDAALGMARSAGIDALTIGALAELTNMSKSGVFAHFGSREDLQVAVVQEYHRRFQNSVFDVAMRAPRGAARLRALFINWIHLVTDEISQGCIYMSGAFEYDDRPGPVRDALVESISAWRAALVRACRQAIECGDIRADTDSEQLVFELFGIILALHHDARLLHAPDAITRAERAAGRVLAACSTQASQPFSSP